MVAACPFLEPSAMAQQPPERCYLVKPRLAPGGRILRRPNVVALPRTAGFGLLEDPRLANPAPPEPPSVPRRRGATHMAPRKKAP